MRFFICLFLALSFNSIYGENSLPLYFSYFKEDIEALKNLNSSLSMDNKQLQKWDKIAEDGVINQKLTFYERTRMFTYLYVAQQEAAFLSKNSKGDFQGSLEPISYKVLTLFLNQNALPQKKSSDPFSETLAKIVFAKIQERVEEEDALPYEFNVPEKLKKDFSAGLIVAKWIPWIAKPSKKYWPPPPPAMDQPEWKEQVRKIQEEQHPITPEKLQAIDRWAAQSDPWSDDWRMIANNYIFDQSVSFYLALKVRSTIMIALYDGVAAYATAKYHFLVIRPGTYDPQVKYLIPVPKHPSYPAGHSAEGAIAATVLSHFFPKDTKKWRELENETYHSRIWAGIHYPIDMKAGKESGTKVANKILQ